MKYNKQKYQVGGKTKTFEELTGIKPSVNKPIQDNTQRPILFDVGAQQEQAIKNYVASIPVIKPNVQNPYQDRKQELNQQYSYTHPNVKLKTDGSLDRRNYDRGFDGTPDAGTPAAKFDNGMTTLANGLDAAGAVIGVGQIASTGLKFGAGLLEKNIGESLLPTSIKGSLDPISRLEKLKQVYNDFKFNNEIKGLKKYHSEAQNYIDNPITQQRLKDFGISEDIAKNIKAPQLTLGDHPNNTNYNYDVTDPTINIKLQEVRDLKGKFELPLKTVYDHEFTHFFQDQLDNAVTYQNNTATRNLYNIARQKHISDGGLPVDQKLFGDKIWGEIVKDGRLNTENYKQTPSILDNIGKNLTARPDLTNTEAASYKYFNFNVEAAAHAKEMRSNMINKGYIKDHFSPIDESTITKFIAENPKDRIASFIEPTPENLVDLKFLLNKVPVVAGVTAAGAAAVQSNKKLGGKIYQNGGTTNLCYDNIGNVIPCENNIKGPIGYLNSYMSSPMFKKRLDGTNKEYLESQKIATNAANKYRPFVLNKEDNNNFIGSQTSDLENNLRYKLPINTSVILSNPQAKDLNADLLNDILPHEYTHNARNLNFQDQMNFAQSNKNPKSTKLFSNYKNLENKKDTYSNWLSQVSPNSHDEQPDENYADLNSLRYMMMKQGIYDTRKRDMTSEDLKKAQEDPWLNKQFSFQRLMNTFKPEDIIKLNNSVASNENINESNYMKNGGTLNSYQTAGIVNSSPYNWMNPTDIFGNSTPKIQNPSRVQEKKCYDPITNMEIICEDDNGYSEIPKNNMIVPVKNDAGQIVGGPNAIQTPSHHTQGDPNKVKPMFGNTFWNSFLGAGKIALTALSEKAKRNRQDEYMNNNLNNPYSGILAYNDQLSDTTKYGSLNMKGGGFVPEMKSGGNVMVEGKPMYRRADGKVVKRGIWSNTYLSKKQDGGEIDNSDGENLLGDLLSEPDIIDEKPKQNNLGSLIEQGFPNPDSYENEDDFHEAVKEWTDISKQVGNKKEQGLVAAGFKDNVYQSTQSESNPARVYDHITESYIANPEHTPRINLTPGEIKTKSDHVNLNINSGLKQTLSNLTGTFPGLVVSSGNDSKHTHNSAHYDGDAVDIGANSSNKQAYANFLNSVGSLSKQMGFKYINEGDHIHVSNSKKGKLQSGGNVNDNNGYLSTNLHNYTSKKIIDSNNITTEGMAFPILANGQPLYPNTGDYYIPGNKVTEVPMKSGGTTPNQYLTQRGLADGNNKGDFNNITPNQAREILHKKSINGKPLTEDQYKLFGFLSKGNTLKYQAGGTTIPRLVNPNEINGYINQGYSPIANKQGYYQKNTLSGNSGTSGVATDRMPNGQWDAFLASPQGQAWQRQRQSTDVVYSQQPQVIPMAAKPPVPTSAFDNNLIFNQQQQVTGKYMYDTRKTDDANYPGQTVKDGVLNNVRYVSTDRNGKAYGDTLNIPRSIFENQLTDGRRTLLNPKKLEEIRQQNKMANFLKGGSILNNFKKNKK